MTTPIAWVAHCPRCGRRVTVSTTGRVETHYVARYSARWPLGSAVAACPGSDTVHPQFRGPTADQGYHLLASGIDCTNARDGTTVAVYCAEDDENRVYVREINEFMDKFQAEPLRVPPYADTLNPEP